MAPDDAITPDPEIEAQAEARVEQQIAAERAREAPIDDAIWAAESEAIERAEADEAAGAAGAAPAAGGGAANGPPGDAPATGWLARIRSWFGR